MPIPNHISQEAQDFLSPAISTTEHDPAPQSTEEWLSFVEASYAGKVSNEYSSDSAIGSPTKYGTRISSGSANSGIEVYDGTQFKTFSATIS